MPPPLLYSTNVFLKFLIQQRFRSDVHYVWCSEIFDAKTQSKYLASSLVPPSSNPADIYKQIKSDIDRNDWHSYKINEQKTSLKKLAIDWEQAGEISRIDKDEIIFMIDTVSFDYWRPLLYIIPRILVDSRLKFVPINKRAGIGPEYIIEDLQRHEFDIIEL